MKRIVQYIYNNKKIAVSLALLCTAIIFIACLIPIDSVPKVNVPMMDKWVHFLVFGAYSIIWSFTLSRFKYINLLLVFISSIVCGWLIEELQRSGITRGRGYEVMDIVADSIGGLLGVIAFMIIYKIFELNKLDK